MPKPLSQITKVFSSFSRSRQWIVVVRFSSDFLLFNMVVRSTKAPLGTWEKKDLLSRPNGFRVSDDFFVSILLVDLGPLRLTPASKRIDCSSWSDGLAIWTYSRFRFRFVKIKKPPALSILQILWWSGIFYQKCKKFHEIWGVGLRSLEGTIFVPHIRYSEVRY